MGSMGGSSQVTVSRPPLVWLLISLLLALAGLAGAILVAPGGSLGIYTWLLSGPVAFALLVVFTVIDNSRRASLFYRVSSVAQLLYWATLVVAFAGVIVSAWHVADWVGRI